MMIRELIFKQTRTVADQQRKTLVPLSDELLLLEFWSRFIKLCHSDRQP